MTVQRECVDSSIADRLLHKALVAAYPLSRVIGRSLPCVQSSRPPPAVVMDIVKLTHGVCGHYTAADFP